MLGKSEVFRFQSLENLSFHLFAELREEKKFNKIMSTKS